MYDFYKCLEKATNNTGKKVVNRYHAFMRMCREYRHLLMLERAGRFHDPSGVDGTQPGELAIRCPCCPRPGVNLREGWENALPEDTFLYIWFLAIDACFRLKRRLVSSELKDPALGFGWAYTVESGPYRQYLLSVTDQKEMSTCSGLAALDYANTKFSRGYSSTGVGMGVCARHEFVQPNGVGDLQKGERYANMDYIFASILRHIDPRLRKIISYNIVCQWWKGVKARLLLLPPLVRLDAVMALMRFVIPKLHIHAHTMACQVVYSLNLVPGSAQTDGEGIERPWANIGGVASSTQEMGPGARDEVLNCHWSFWNWQKLVGMGTFAAIFFPVEWDTYNPMESFASFSMQQSERVPGWKAIVETFEKNPKAKNPYEIKVRGLTEAQVLLKLEQQESERLEVGVPSVHRVSPSSFIAAGLEVEEQQRRVRVQVELKKAQMTAQQIDMVGIWRQLSKTYEAPADEQPENTPLFLPSVLPVAQQEEEALRGLQVMEDEIRDAQCTMALVSLRLQLHIKSRFFTYKNLQTRNQGPNTRARSLVNRNESKIRLHSEKYQMAWEAKHKLAGGDASKVGWRLLRQEDIRCMEDPEEREKR
ncbi:hypothetical protein DFH06DRAFT_1265705 [Mycena polygramma]|nr:hypothetical protein DFH06DRAFT_1265705 [Mycena polygramma]